MKRRHACDVCGHDRQRWQRLCGVCWDQLPATLRKRITETHRLGFRKEWRAAKREAILYLAERVARHMARYAAQLGERAI